MMKTQGNRKTIMALRSAALVDNRLIYFSLVFIFSLQLAAACR
jgi:hypothetical protein